jgi:5-methyltetrahydropteroyltriglutamate--homocysteine methyltransferase
MYSSISPLYPLAYSFDDVIDCFTITFSDGHQRKLPRLIKAPFQYGKYAVDYVRRAQQYTCRPIKQAVISPSALSNVYPKATISGYSREEFLDDLVNEAEKDIRLCLDAGVEKVQMDFTEARLSLKIDPTGELLKRFVQLNNRVFDRFSDNCEYQSKLGVHICPGKMSVNLVIFLFTIVFLLFSITNKHECQRLLVQRTLQQLITDKRVHD